MYKPKIQTSAGLESDQAELGGGQMEEEETELPFRAWSCGWKTRVAFTEPKHVGNVRHLVHLLRTYCSGGGRVENKSSSHLDLGSTP